MRQLGAQSLTSLISATLTLITLLGTDRLVCENLAEPVSSEDCREDVEADDLDDIDALANDGIATELATATSALFEVGHDSPLLTHAWRWCSRGPPLTALPQAV